MSYYRLTPNNIAPRAQRQIEPILMRLTRNHYQPAPLKPITFAPVLHTPIHCTTAMVYGVNGTPRCRMRHQVQLGEGAPAWRGEMPTDRYERIAKQPPADGTTSTRPDRSPDAAAATAHADPRTSTQ